MTSGWTWYVIAIVVANLIGCLWLLRANTRRSPTDPKPDETGHVWDGNITEYNKPLPRWWINLFYITIVFAVGFWIGGIGGGTAAAIGVVAAGVLLVAAAFAGQPRLRWLVAPALARMRKNRT